jgi:hypothetical protein
MLKRKLKRDCVISLINGKNLVGVYLTNDPDNILAEMEIEKADKIIKLWNSK